MLGVENRALVDLTQELDVAEVDDETLGGRSGEKHGGHSSSGELSLEEHDAKVSNRKVCIMSQFGDILQRLGHDLDTSLEVTLENFDKVLLLFDVNKAVGESKAQKSR